MELLLIRHGEPRWVDNGLPVLDPHLTVRGKQQAQAVADRLSKARRPVDELIVSPAHRARETAAPISETLRLAPRVIDDLVEIRLPDWSQKSAEAIGDVFLNARKRPLDEWWNGLDGGESFRDFHARVTKALRELLKERGAKPAAKSSIHAWKVAEEGKRIAIVAHGGTNAVIISHLLGLEPIPWEWERFMLMHASIVKIRAVPLGGDFVWSLRSAGDVEHLEVADRSG